MLTVLADVALVRKTSTLWPIESLNTETRPECAIRRTHLALPNIWPGTERERENRRRRCACVLSATAAGVSRSPIETRRKKVKNLHPDYIFGFVSVCG
jgi:hypothetical protein